MQVEHLEDDFTSYIDELAENEPIFIAIREGLDVAGELSTSPALKLALQVMKKDADQAIELLIWADPTDIKAIISLQTRIRVVRGLKNTLDAIIRRGIECEMAVKGLDYE